jgi:chromosome partitioning protein
MELLHPVKTRGALDTIAFLSQKGGGGKTTLAVHCAVAALADGSRVAIIDTDPQGTATRWGQERKADTPAVAKATAQQLDDVLAAARHDVMTYCLIDSAPHATPSASRVAAAADFIIVPVRPTAFDLAAVPATMAIIQASGKRAAFVLSACPTRSAETAEATDVLESYGIPVAPAIIHERRAFSRAVATGRAVAEFEPGGKAAQEITELWSWIKSELQK